MIVVTTPYLSGHRVSETKGQVFGLVVRSRGFSGNLAAYGTAVVVEPDGGPIATPVD